MTNTGGADILEVIKYFPQIDLPITLTYDVVPDFSKNNKILPQLLIDKFLNPYLDTSDSEFREIIPCFLIPDTHDFYGLVIWVGELLSYEYKLITFDKQGNFISGKTIAGTLSDGSTIHQSVATIDPDWMIYIVAGEGGSDDSNYEASSSKAFNMELLANGEIVFSLDD